MKKLSLVLSALLCALVMVSCANPAGGKDTDSNGSVSSLGVPNGLYKMYKISTVEEPLPDEMAGTNPIFYINYIDGKLDLVGKGTDGTYKITGANAGKLNADKTYEISIPAGEGETSKGTGTWKYENNLLDVSMNNGNVTITYTYKKIDEPVKK